MKCNGNDLARRGFLSVGVVGGLGLSLGDFFRMQQARGDIKNYASHEGTAKSVICIFLPGGMAHQETFDPKPFAPVEYRGPLGSIETNVSGIRMGELLPHTAKVADNHFSIAMVVPLGEVAPGASKAFESRLFAGPQEEHKLAALSPGLELVKDYGWFTVLAKPLFWLLDKLHALLGNWGWAIVALVFLLKAAFYWLNASAYKSMAKMKAINPRVMEMRERLKDKPQQMQQEMMRMYREEKVNPLGGCLPIVAQMPFFIALYWVLLSSVEMRGAPWIGWITDLSTKDPFFILPLLMTASTMFQTWLNPTPPDPVQAKLMWFMPLIFSVMFFFFPAGLVLYC